MRKISLKKIDSQALSNLISFLALGISIFTFWSASHETKESEKFKIRIRTEFDEYRNIQIVKTQIYKYSGKGYDELFLIFPVRVTIINISRLPQYLQNIDIHFDQYLEKRWNKIFQPNNEKDQLTWPQKIESMDALDFDVMFYYPLNKLTLKQLHLLKVQNNSIHTTLDTMSEILEGGFKKDSLRNLLLSLPTHRVKFILNFLSPSVERQEIKVPITLQAPLVKYDNEHSKNYNSLVIYQSFKDDD